MSDKDIQAQVKVPSREEIIKELAKDKWGIELMHLAIAAKKESRDSKEKPFHCFVLDESTVDSDDGEVSKATEVTDFLKFVADHAREIEDGTRFQLAIRVGSLVIDSKEDQDQMHWLTADVIVDKGQMKVFFLDSAIVPHTNNLVIETSKILPTNAEIYLYGLELFEEEIDPMQRDKASCSRFTLENTFYISKLPVHDILKANQNTFDLHQYKERNFYNISGERLPVEFAPIFKNLQDYDLLGKLDATKDVVINKKGETLLQYI